MRLAFVWKVASKELLSTWRDRRTLTSVILLPLIMIPLFTIGFPLLIGRSLTGQQEARQKVGVVGTLPSELRTLLTRDVKAPGGAVTQAGVTLVPVTDPLRAVRDGDVEAALEVPANLPVTAGSAPRKVKVYSNANNQRVQAGAANKIREAVRAFNDSLVARGLAARGLNASFLAPVSTTDVDASNPSEKSGGALAFIIPFFLLQFIMSGAMPPAIDSTAGEKERGTLEVLLVSPVRRLEVVVGKLLATTVFAVVTAIFGTLGFLLAGPVGRLVIPPSQLEGALTASFGGTLSVSVGGFLTLLAIALTSALLLSALLIAISVFARSFREAQTYLTPVMLLLIVPLIALQFSDFLTKSAALYAIPIFGGALAILDIVRGTLEASHAVSAIASNLAFTLIFTLFALRSFRREQVIFRT
ncbi:ABC transporter permease [Deinococcus yavapaiensis]|uniref:Sodium transport system permease protein n=1 Tax=Deinococcus yavapaiensis KR-236 TaxID=694435 RepID=A0A318SAZ9_9DEIO|nr:ABC transporter permease [Deinococcus yavapaiensis]PYE56238.1 sodium transport system permease protein [Deinococcus yavapaiensis KR-236]